MKIHLNGRPKQYAFVKVTCLDSIMVEMLLCVPDAVSDASVEKLTLLRNARSAMLLHRFYHGSHLTVGLENNEFFIQGMLFDGSDTKAAVEELKMLDSLRLAKKHFLAMKQECFNLTVNALHLRVTQY